MTIHTSDTPCTAVFDNGRMLSVGRILSLSEASCRLEVDEGRQEQRVRRSQILFMSNSVIRPADMEKARSEAEALGQGACWKATQGKELTLGFLASRLCGTDNCHARLVTLYAYLADRPFFQRMHDDIFRPIPEEIGRKILVSKAERARAIESNRLLLNRMENGDLSMISDGQVNEILFSKKSVLGKLVAQHCKGLGIGKPEFLRIRGALESELDYHRRWLIEHFSLNSSEPEAIMPDLPDSLGFNQGAHPVTLDRAGTDEIDDALTIIKDREKGFCIRSHICLPSIAIPAGSPLDMYARFRMSTIYTPQEKFTMLPRSIYRRFSLVQGKVRPVLTVEARIDEGTGNVEVGEPFLEKVLIQANHFFPDVANDRLLESYGFPPEEPMRWLIASLRKRRAGSVTSVRQRKAISMAGQNAVDVAMKPVGLAEELLAEMMILTNAKLATFASENNIPVIYRMKGNSVLRPGEHREIGHSCYGWFTSPLRRYSDLVNIRQVLGFMLPDSTFQQDPKSILAAVAKEFNVKYSQTLQAQKRFERFFILNYLKQNSDKVWDATCIDEDHAVINGFQIEGNLLGTGFKAKAPIKVTVSRIDPYELTVEFRVVSESA